MSEIAYWNQMYANACEGQRPFMLLRPRIFMDGNQWCVLYGDNIQDGVAGFGDSPETAAWNFDKAWCEKIGEQKVRVAHNPKCIEATGNTKAEADAVLDRKREAISDKNENATFGEVREYGNFELGYKLVQEYSE